MAGIDQPQDPIFVHNEITAELEGVVAVRVVEFSTLKPAFDVNPYHARMIRAQARAFELVGLVNCAVTIKQNIERAANFVHPLLESGECSKGNDKDAGIQLGEFVLVRAQLCGMFAAGYSAKMTEEDQQGVSAFEDFAEGDLFTVNGLKGEVGGGSVGFECHGIQCQVSSSSCQVSGELEVLRVPCLRVYLCTKDCVLPRSGVEG